MLNVPNAITILRIVLVPAFMVMMYSNRPYAVRIAVLFYAVAAFTDLVDGHIARKFKLVTNLGKVLDPVADKILVAAAMVVLVDKHMLASWIVVVMLFRDFAVGALRDVAAQQGTIIAAGVWGKLKTILQMVALGFIMFHDTLVIWPVDSFGILSQATPAAYIGIPSQIIGDVLIYIALIASVFSGVIYFLQFWKLLANIKQN